MFLAAYAVLLLLTTTCQGLPSIRRTGLTATLTGNPVYFGTGTYPRAIRLASGTLLGSYTSFANGENTIQTCQSTNNGVTWSQLGSVTTGVGDIDNAFLLQLPNGRVLAAFRNHSKDSSGAYTYFRITVCSSDDNGKSWKYLSQPVGDTGPVTGDW